MARMRSPSYPAISLSEAIELVRKIHEKSRTNAIDRDAAARDLGYSGITGRSLTVLAALIQFGLLEKAGKGTVRVSRNAVDIFHGFTDEVKKNALLKAGTSPSLYQEIMERFPDGVPSENALRSYLIQREFADVAIGPAVSSFLETYRTLEDANVFESSGPDPVTAPESSPQPLKVDDAVSQTTATSPTLRANLATPAAPIVTAALNKIRMNIQGDKVKLDALLDLKGIELLEKKLASLKDLLDEPDENAAQEKEGGYTLDNL